eukprot:jgi/Chlat1/4929/Chrsp31S04846
MLGCSRCYRPDRLKHCPSLFRSSVCSLWCRLTLCSQATVAYRFQACLAPACALAGSGVHLIAAAAAFAAYATIGLATRLGRASPSSLPPVAMAAAWLLLLALLVACASALTVDELYPFGAVNGDTTMNRCYSCASDMIRLPFAVPVFGVASVRGVYINSNGKHVTCPICIAEHGAVHFRQPYSQGSPAKFPLQAPYYSMVAGFWARLWNVCPNCGETTYRTVDDTAVLAGISADVRAAFPTEQLATGFIALTAFIVTWNTTARCCMATDEAETFQTVIAFNIDTTFIFLLYANDRPQTTFLSNFAQAGFNAGDGVRGYNLPGSRTAAIGNASRLSSNIGQPGKWCFGLNAFQTLSGVPYYPSGISDTAGMRLDACGNTRVFKWDVNGDGAFDDADGTLTILDNSVQRLPVGVHTTSVQVSSPSCPASPPEVRSTTLNVITTPPVINSVRVSTLSGGPNTTVGVDIPVSTRVALQECFPFTQTVDCGLDNVARDTEPDWICQYSSIGVKVITVTVRQFDFVVSHSITITIFGFSIGGPYDADICQTIRLNASPSLDACRLQQLLAWDLDNDGKFYDATGQNPSFNAYKQGLGPGIHTVSVRASSSRRCSDNHEKLSTTVNVTIAPLAIRSLTTHPTPSGNKVASVAEDIIVRVQRSGASCAPVNLTIDCGPDSVSAAMGYCRYNSAGIKTITATVVQYGATASRSLNITVTTFYMGGPYSVTPCSSLFLAAPTTIDACGGIRQLVWDFNDDGSFSDAAGSTPYLSTGDFQLAPGVHPVRVQSSSSPACPASPTEMHTVNMTITAGVKLAINGISTHPAGNIPVATTGSDIAIVVTRQDIHCLPWTVTLDCGAGSVSTAYLCRYNTPGEKVISATLTQNGVSVSRSRNLTVAAYYIGGPHSTYLCGSVNVFADGGADECGKARTLAWDLNNDGQFDDAKGSKALFDAAALHLPPGLYPIRVQASSSDPASCPNAVPLVLITNVTITGSIPPPIIYSMSASSGNARADTGEAIEITTQLSLVYCLPYNLTINCGPDHVEDVEVSISLNVTVITTPPSCTTAAFPKGRVRGKHGCSSSQWQQLVGCYHPDNIKPYTKLYDAFASRASYDAQLIQRYFGNRTIAQALGAPLRQVDLLALEATAALLNAETVYYAQCPLSVKLNFRHGLYNAKNRTKVQGVLDKFYYQNVAARAGCPSSDDFDNHCQ